MKESALENKLRLAVQREGGFCIKLNPIWNIGIPDRLIILQNRVIFCELKKPKGGRFSGTQKFWARRLATLGCEYWQVNSEERISAMLRGEIKEKTPLHGRG